MDCLQYVELLVEKEEVMELNFLCKTFNISTLTLNFTLVKNIMKLSFIVKFLFYYFLIKLRHGVFLILKRFEGNSKLKCWYLWLNLNCEEKFPTIFHPPWQDNCILLVDNLSLIIYQQYFSFSVLNFKLPLVLLVFRIIIVLVT